MFDEFYNKYPNKKARTHANTAYDKVIKKGVSHEKIMAGLSNYLADLDKNPREKSKIKHPSTWLNGGCYDDEYEVQSSYRKDMKAIPGDAGETIYTYTSRIFAERVEAANVWWKANGHKPALAFEYRYRCRFGEPTAEDLAKFERQARRQPPSPVRGFSTVYRPKVKPNYLPMKRDVVRAKSPPGTVPTTPRDASEVADSGVQLETSEENVQSVQNVQSDHPPEPPPVQSEAEYGAGTR